MNAPEPEHIAISKSKGIKIDWKDGHHSDYELGYLRDECPCATCNDERGKKEAFKSLAPGMASSPVLPMFKPKPSAKAATQVGNYAIQITFNDGHSTGIYAYDHLRSICPCEECAKAFRTASAS